MKSPLTSQFSFETIPTSVTTTGTGLKFPKLIKHKAVRNFKNYAWNSTIKKTLKLLRRKRPTRAVKRKHLPTISKLKAEANRVFGNYIKNRDNWTCVLCGKTKANAVITNGHLIKRGKKIHLFSELNCHALCGGCNKLDNYDHDIYVNWFIRKYGLEAYQELYDTKEILFQIKRNYLEEIIKKYENNPPKD